MSYFQDKTLRLVKALDERLRGQAKKVPRANRRAFQHLVDNEWANIFLDAQQGLPSDIFDQSLLNRIIELEAKANSLGFPKKLNVVNPEGSEYSFDPTISGASMPFEFSPFPLLDPVQAPDAPPEENLAQSLIGPEQAPAVEVPTAGPEPVVVFPQSFCNFSVARSPDGAACILDARCQLVNGETGEVRTYEKSVDLAPIIQKLGDVARRYHERMHREHPKRRPHVTISGSHVSIGNIDDLLQSVLHTARALAQNQTAKQIFAEAEPLLALTVPGGPAAYALTKHSQTVVNQAEDGDPQALAMVHELQHQAALGDPTAQETLDKMRLISKAQKVKAIKMDRERPPSLWMRGLGKRRSDRRHWGIITIGHDPVTWVGRAAVVEHRQGYTPTNQTANSKKWGATIHEAWQRGFTSGDHYSSGEPRYTQANYDAAVKWLNAHPYATRGVSAHPLANTTPSSPANPYGYPPGYPPTPGLPYPDPYGLGSGYPPAPYGAYPLDPYGLAGGVPGFNPLDPYGLAGGFNPLDPYGLLAPGNPLTSTAQVYDPATDSFFSSAVQQKYDPTTDSFYPVTNANPYNPYDPLAMQISGWFHDSPYRNSVVAALQPGPTNIHRETYYRGLNA